MLRNLRNRIKKIEMAAGMHDNRDFTQLVASYHMFCYSGNGETEEYCAVLKRDMAEPDYDRKSYRFHLLECPDCTEKCQYAGWEFPEHGTEEDERFTKALQLKLAESRTDRNQNGNRN